MDKYGHSSVGQPPEVKDKNYYSVLSFIMAIAPIILFAWLFMVGGFDGSSGSAATGFVVAIYYWTVGIPFAILSIVFGIKGLQTSRRRLAIVSLTIKTIMLVTILLFFIIGNLIGNLS